jgi:hypothetical protein
LVPDQIMRQVRWDEVRARTGWPLPAEPPAPFAAEPDEVRTLRRFVDPGGLLAPAGPPATIDAGKH